MGESRIELAKPGDNIGAEDLKPTSEGLIAMAKSLEPAIEKAKNPQQLAQLMRANGELLAQARKLIEGDIALVVGEAKILADQVRAAIDEANKVIAKVAKVKAKLAKVGAVLDFIAAVFTGSGTKIFEAANMLKDDLSKP